MGRKRKTTKQKKMWIKHENLQQNHLNSLGYQLKFVEEWKIKHLVLVIQTKIYRFELHDEAATYDLSHQRLHNMLMFLFLFFLLQVFLFTTNLAVEKVIYLRLYYETKTQAVSVKCQQMKCGNRSRLQYTSPMLARVTVSQSLLLNNAVSLSSFIAANSLLFFTC